MPTVFSIKALALACVSTSAAGFTSPSFTNTQKCFIGNNHDNNHPACRQPRHVTSSPPPLSSTLSSSSVVDYADIDIAETADRDIMAFDAIFAPQSGIQRSDGFKLVEEDNDGREVYATTTTDAPTGSPVLFVPESLILSSTKAMAELRGYAGYAGMDEAEQYVSSVGAESEFRHYYLMLKILLEIQNGKQSRWFLWLNSLPRYLSNAVAMTDFCTTCLPPLMKKLAQEEREAQQRLSVESIQAVPFLGDDIKNHPKDMVKWAYQIVYTRAVETEDGDLVIIPMADYFNHGSDYTEITSSFDQDGNYYAYTSYDVPAGSPLRISYADPRNPSHLLARYGFLDENCPATYCKLLPPTVNQDMLDLGYSHDKMLFYSNGEVADEVWDIFLYDCLNQESMDDQEALMNAHRTGNYDLKLALHEKWYEQTSAALLEHVDSFIEDMDKLIQKAETIGVSDPNSIYIRNEHPRLPLIHRHNIFVRETFQAVRNRYSSDESWRDATRCTVQECDDNECAIAECVMMFNGEWACEGGLGPNWDGSERQKSQTVISSS
ncbi:hypothetical protein ACHAXR_008217 [Thalassiosira sp. AJA248-18]